MSSNLDVQTGLSHRTVNMQAVYETIKIPIYGRPKGPDLFGRVSGLIQYINKFVKDELWLYNRRMLTGPATEVLAQDDNFNILFGVNYASADYLGLAQHPLAKEAAIKAAKEYGLSSAGTPSTLGTHKLYLQLQKQLSQYWDTNILIYSTGWMAGYGVIKGLVREYDFVIMDNISHNCLQEGAMAATKNIKKFEHLNQNAMVQILKQTRQANPDSAILVITQGLFSMDSDSPDLKFYQKVTKQHNAFLLIDCAHDFGHLGAKGRGVWEVQNLEDRSNVILVGTGSKCLSTNIGFIGIQDKKIIKLLKHMSTAYMHTTVINPAQAATSLAQLKILRSEEGNQRRRKVVKNYNYLRAKLEANGRKIFGNSCAIMPVFVGNEVVCRLVSRIMMDLGVHVNGIQYPVVKIGQARLRVSLMPQHTKEHLDTFVKVFEISLKKANEIYERQLQKYTELMQKQQQAKL